MSFGFGVGDFIAVHERISKIHRHFTLAPSQFKDIFDEAQSLGRILKHIEGNLQCRLTTQQRAEQAEILSSCRSVLAAIEETLRRYDDMDPVTRGTGETRPRAWRAAARRILKRSRWDPDEIQYHRSRIISQLALLKAFRDEVARYENLEPKILTWIAPSNHEAQLAYHLKRLQEGTGRWLLESSEFRSWLAGKKSVLLCHGIPGAGKTILTSFIVNHLCQQYHDESQVAVAYIFCEFKRRHEQNYCDLLASLLRQLAQVSPAPPSSVRCLYDRHQKYGTRPSASQLENELGLVIAQFSKVFFIIDALDECHEIARASLVAGLSRLRAKCGISLLATSNRPDILASFDECRLLEIRARDADIYQFLQARLPLLPSFVSREVGLQEKIKTEVVEASDGMFLLAELYIDSLTQARSRKEMDRTLRQLPRGSNAHVEAYDKIMERIKEQVSKKLAKDALALITFTKRPLSALELQHALAVEPGERQLDPSNFKDITDIISACAGFARVDEENGIVRLVHHTAQEYLQRQCWFTEPEENISEICVTYLSFDEFENGRCHTDQEFERRLTQHPFYGYAASNWGLHIRATSTETSEMSLKFLQNEKKLHSCSQAMLAQEGQTWRGYSQRVPGDSTGLHLAAYFGLNRAMAILVARGTSPASTDTQGRTPLSWAAERGHVAAVELLLDEGGDDVACTDSFGRTAMIWAAMSGHEPVVRLLLKTGIVNVDLKDEGGRTALSWAAGNGHTGVIQLLLDTDAADVNSIDEFGRTPLSWAAEHGAEAATKLILASEMASIDGTDDRGRTSFSRAAESGHNGILELLLVLGDVHVDSKDKSGRTPISWAAENGHASTVELLLQTGKVDLNVKDEDGRTAFSWAVGNGHTAVIRLLLDRVELDADSPDKIGHTPLLWAAGNGHTTAIHLLLESGKVNAGSADPKGRTAFLWAARHGQQAVVNFLHQLEDIDVDRKDTNGRTAFSWAAGNGHKAVVQFLVDVRGVDIDSTDSSHRTPLSWAAGNGHDGIVHLLLGRDKVNADSKDTDKRTPLSWAAECGQAAAVGLLIGTGTVDVCSMDKYGRTPLLLAASGGHYLVVKQLLGSRKAGIDMMDHNGQTPLSHAKDGGHDEVVKLLEDYPAVIHRP